MAQQIKIDIIADAKKLSEGLNEVNKQTGIFTDKAKTAFAAASAAASAYAAKLIGDGVKSAIADEQAQVRLAGALKNVTGATDAQIKSVENWITQQGKLYGFTDDQLRPAIERLVGSTKDITEAQKLANLAMDIAAQKNIDVETAANALAKANDGNVNALKKLGITLGDNATNVASYNKEQKALNKLLDDQQFALDNYGPKSKEYAKATEKVSEQQKLLSTYTKESIDWVGELSKQFEGSASKAADTNAGKMKILATRVEELKEGIGAALLPIIDKLTTFLLKLLDAFSSLPGPIQNIILGLLGIVAVGGPLLGFLANAKVAMATLGLVTAETTAATVASRVATIAQTAATGIATAAQAAFNAVMAANPIALVVLAIVALIAIIVLLVKNWDTVTEVVGKVWDKIKNFVSDAKEAIGNFVSSAVSKFGEFKEKISGFVNDVIERIKEIPGKMFDIGKNIVTGLWNGIYNMADWLKNKVLSFLGNLLPSWAEKALGIASPSKVFSAIGQNIVKGLTTPLSSVKSIAIPQMATAGGRIGGVTNNITINAGLGTDPYKLGREVNKAIGKYGQVSVNAASRRAVL